MPFYEIFLTCAVPCVLFGILVYVTEYSWRASDDEQRLNRVRRIVSTDTRPHTRELPQLPWKHDTWN